MGYRLPNAYILDTFGIVTPESIRYHADLINDMKPDYVVALDMFTRASLIPDKQFQTEYREVFDRATHKLGGKSLSIYERQSREATQR